MAPAAERALEHLPRAQRRRGPWRPRLWRLRLWRLRGWRLRRWPPSLLRGCCAAAINADELIHDPLSQLSFQGIRASPTQQDYLSLQHQ